MRAERYGDRAILVTFDDEREVGPWAAAVEAGGDEGVIDVVRGATTVVLVGERGRGTEALERIAAGIAPAAVSEHVAGDVVEIPVRYDGEDLADVAAATRLSVAEVGALHLSATYEVAFCGFAPGFGYLTGLPETLHLPRRATPRPRVPAGALAIADRYTGVYPTASPGGWSLIGTALASVWDLAQDPPAVLTPGRRVRFVPE